MLLLSAVYSSDEQARAWGWEAAQGRECHGSLEGLLSSCEDKPTTGHKDWLSITQPALKREEIEKGRPEQCMAERFKGWLCSSQITAAPRSKLQTPGTMWLP